MDELIDKVKKCINILEVDIDKKYDNNELLYAIIYTKRYDLLNNSYLKIDFSNMDTAIKLIEYLLSDEDILYDIRHNGYIFSKQELDYIFNIVYQKYAYDDDYKLDSFFRNFFSDKEELDVFIKNKKDIFEKYLQDKKSNVSYVLKGCNSFIELILKNKYIDMISDIENYSNNNLILLAGLIRDGYNLPYYLGQDRFSYKLFEIKNQLDDYTFYTLLNLLQDKKRYNVKLRDSDKKLFELLVEKNIEYLIQVVSSVNEIPRCLLESNIFRDECIKRNRIDLASKCILPIDIINDESLSEAYCKELNINLKDFYERVKWIINYQEKNNNISNTLLATSLKNNIYNLNKEHYERFINDISVQMYLDRLNDKELIILSKILDKYNYKDYDISLMIVSIIKNIKVYQELTNKIDINNIDDNILKKLVSVLLLSDNPYNINSLESLEQYNKIKDNIFISNFNNKDIIKNKDYLLKLLFNISLEEAIYMDNKYCYRNDNTNMLDSLKDSELPSNIYNYLLIINKIVTTNNINVLEVIYNNLKEENIYDYEIPLELYLRAKYTSLYSKTLYQTEDNDKNIFNEVNFKDKKVSQYIPRSDFNFFIHCVGSCSNLSDIYDSNYRKDWLDRPRLQDHFIACSYINERGINSVRSQGSIIYGFASLEDGAILGMGNTDIDSIGTYSKEYDGSRKLQEGNGDRARFYVPSEMLKTINEGYNEIVIERRNTKKDESDEIKRKPDYIIMMMDTIEENLYLMSSLYNNQLSFINNSDREEINNAKNKRSIKKCLDKYNDVIINIASINGINLDEMINIYIDLIMNAKYYEDCLKAASEFDIPLVIIDKKYYFKKIMYESGRYSDEMMEEILELYNKGNSSDKKKIFNMVAIGEDIKEIFKSKENKGFTISM